MFSVQSRPEHRPFGGRSFRHRRSLLMLIEGSLPRTAIKPGNLLHELMPPAPVTYRWGIDRGMNQRAAPLCSFYVVAEGLDGFFFITARVQFVRKICGPFVPSMDRLLR